MFKRSATQDVDLKSLVKRTSLFGSITPTHDIKLRTLVFKGVGRAQQIKSDLVNSRVLLIDTYQLQGVR